MNKGFKFLGIIITFGGAIMLFYGLIDPLYETMNNIESELLIGFGAGGFIFGGILIWISRSS